MRRLLFLIGLTLALPSIAEVHLREYNAATTIPFKLYDTSTGGLDVDEVDAGTEVTLYCDDAAGATATNDFVDEGPYYSIALTATETQCARIAIEIAATDTNVVFVETFGNASATTDEFPANVISVAGTAQTANDNGADINAILVDTAEIGAAGAGLTESGGTGDQLTALATAANLATVDTNVDAILVDTAEIGAAGAGLTEAGGTGDQFTAIPWAAAWDTEVQSEANDALVALGLDHMVSASVAGTDITDNSIIAQMVGDDATADWDTFDNTTDSLEAIRNRGDASWTTGGGGSCTGDVGCIADGTAQSVTGTTIQLASAETFADDELIGGTVLINSATAGTGQARIITDYVGSTDTATVDTWTTTPTGTVTYRVFGTPPGSDSSPAPANVVQISGDATAADNLELAADGGGYNLGGGSVVAASVTGAVGSVTGNVGGNVTGSVGSVTGNVGGIAGTITTLDALDTAQDTQHSSTQTDIAGLNDLDAAGVRTAVGLASANLDTQLTNIDPNAVLEQLAKVDPNILNCEVNTANFAGSTTTVACILTDRDGVAVTQATGDLEGKLLEVLSGDQIREYRYINDTTWDGANSELQLTLSRALPATLADAVTAVIR